MISIHASRGGSDAAGKHWIIWRQKFQSTLPAGEATYAVKFYSCVHGISIHASRGGSDVHHGKVRWETVISIHASRGGSDPVIASRRVGALQFQSTLPAGEATSAAPSYCPGWWNFNPRFPRGKRPSLSSRSVFVKRFQSTLPAGEATWSRRWK